MRPTSARRTWRDACRLLALVIVVLWAPPAGAQVRTVHLEPPPPSRNGIVEWELNGWLDRWFTLHLTDAESGAPGAVVVVVEGDRVIALKAYGYSDLETRTPATTRTVFRVGSLSKPVTATAVMQLVEAGRVEPGRPVNDYLDDLQVPVAFGRAVTVRDLVTHTAGFDVRLEGTAAPSDDRVEPLGPYLRHALPPQVRPSGEVLAYSNHGYTLLGHLVERLSGLKFEDYAAQRIFQPLGMTRSGFRLTPELARQTATGYEHDAGEFRPAVIVHPNIYPAAGLNTTAEDMARFLVAQLNGGRAGDARILTGAAVDEMHRRQFTMSPGMPGMAFGFFETFSGDERALVHGGGIYGFASGLALWPGRRLGLFVANNGDSDALVRDLVGAFAFRFLPRPPRVQDRPSNDPPLEVFTGAYRAATQTMGTIEKASALRGDDLEVRIGGFWSRLAVGSNVLKRVSRGEFVGADAGERFGFVTGPRDGRTYLLTSDPFFGNVAWVKLRWFETARFHRELLVLFVGLFLSAFAVPAARLARRFRRRGSPVRTPAPGPGARVATALLCVVSGLCLAFLVLLVVAFGQSGGTGVLFGLPPLARVALRLNLATAAVSVALFPCAWLVWRRRYWPLAYRIHYTFCVAAAVGFAAWSWGWHLLGA